MGKPATDSSPNHDAARHHRRAAQGTSGIFAVLTVSDTRTAADDRSGALLKEKLEAAGHRLGAYEIVPDEVEILTDPGTTVVYVTRLRVIAAEEEVEEEEAVPAAEDEEGEESAEE